MAAARARRARGPSYDSVECLGAVEVQADAHDPLVYTEREAIRVEVAHRGLEGGQPAARSRRGEHSAQRARGKFATSHSEVA
jgi:hypothetical protein